MEGILVVAVVAAAAAAVAAVAAAAAPLLAGIRQIGLVGGLQAALGICRSPTAAAGTEIAELGTVEACAAVNYEMMLDPWTRSLMSEDPSSAGSSTAMGFAGGGGS